MASRENCGYVWCEIITVIILVAFAVVYSTAIVALIEYACSLIKGLM